MKIKPCPFCGREFDNLIFKENETRPGFETNRGYKWGSVVCRCGARGPEVRTNFKNPETGWGEEAIKEWNERACTNIFIKQLEAAKNALEYAAYNHAGMRLEHLPPGIIESTSVAETCLIEVKKINELLADDK